ncbi:MAG: exosortase B [Pseudomonadota bacterium]|nr:exosortase B [Pseudomonadota bacterium]
MSNILEEGSLAHAAPRAGWRPWIALLLGLALLYIPTYVDLSKGLWRDDAYAHGPIILVVFAWLLWRRREVLLDNRLKAAPLAGAILLAFGLAMYLLGRTQSLTVFEVSSHLPVILGCVLLVRGFEGVKRLAFPLAFLLFLVPLPGFVLEALTSPLKQLVSASVAGLLQALGYGVERSGVVLEVGGRELLVADACSGLNSLYSLFAVGLLYAHLVGRRSIARTALVVAGIVPIAIAANILRVLALVLVTVHLGEEAAQGFLHDFAGFFVFASAFLMLVGYDKLVRRLTEKKMVSETISPSPGSGERVSDTIFPRLSGIALVAGAAMALTAAAAPALKPVATPGAAANLEQLIPASFAGWHIDPDDVPVAPSPDVEANLARLYGQIVSRTYVNASGERMMLTVAHGGDQSDALKAHRQEVCYRAQGFEIRTLAHGNYSTAGRTIPVTRMLAVRGERSEPVTYWFTMGDRVVLGRLERLKVQLENGLAGRVPDGMLVRVSSLSTDAPRAFAAQESFMSAIVAAIPAGETARLIGAPQG